MDRHPEEDNMDIGECCNKISIAYSKYIKSNRECEFGSTKKEMSSIGWNAFHTALIKGNDNVFNLILDNIDNDDITKWLLNTSVDFDCVDKEVVQSKRANSNQIETSIKLTKCINARSKGIIRNSKIITNDRNKNVSFELPLSLAAAGGSEIILMTLVWKDADVHGLDSAGNNIIHNLVQLSTNAPRRSVRMFECLLKVVDNVYDIEKLLHTKNAKKRKPIDLAAYSGLPEMLNAIINTEGIYRHTIDDMGDYKQIYYNVTDYEQSDSITSESIVYHLTNVDEKQLLRIHRFGLLQKEPFITWFDIKFKKSRKVISIHLILWMLFVFTFLVKTWLLLASENATVIGNLSFLVLCFAAFTLLVEIGYAHENWKHLKNVVVMAWKHTKYPVTFLFPYRMIQIVFCCTCIIGTYGDINPCSFTFINITHAINAVCGTLSVLFFMQLNKGFGHLLITVQKMVYVSMLFSSMILLTYLGYTMALYILHVNISWGCTQYNNTELTTNTHNISSGFDTFGGSLYTTMLLMFLISAPYNTAFSQSTHPVVTSVIYLSLVIFVGIICMNLLIALMSQRMEEIDILKDDILLLQRISIVLFFEERIRSPVMRCCVKCCCCCCRRLQTKNTRQ